MLEFKIYQRFNKTRGEMIKIKLKLAYKACRLTIKGLKFGKKILFQVIKLIIEKVKQIRRQLVNRVNKLINKTLIMGKQSKEIKRTSKTMYASKNISILLIETRIR